MRKRVPRDDPFSSLRDDRVMTKSRTLTRADKGPRGNCLHLLENLERAKGFEPSTPTLANSGRTVPGGNRK